jgi:hypothetical protein
MQTQSLAQIMIVEGKTKFTFAKKNAVSADKTNAQRSSYQESLLCKLH